MTTVPLQRYFTASKVKQWFRTTRMVYMMNYTGNGVNTLIRDLKDRIKRSLELKSLLRWNVFILILNLLKQGGYSMRWNNFNDFILWAVSFEAVRALCFMLWTGLNYVP